LVRFGSDSKAILAREHVGDWTGGAYTNDETGAFSHCAAGGQYREGTYLVLSHNIDSSWSIGFANQSWNMAIQETLPIGVTFDGRAQARLFARVITAQSMVAILPHPVLQNLRKSQLMVAEVNGQTIYRAKGSFSEGAGGRHAQHEDCAHKTEELPS
jgi:hypothetical protein